MGFTLLVGPFVMLGTFLVATKDGIGKLEWRDDYSCLAYSAAGAYISFAIWGAIFDSYLTNACSKGRRLVLDVAKENDAVVIGHEYPSFPKIIVACFVAYMTGFIILLWAFASVAILVWKLLTQSPAEGC